MAKRLGYTSSNEKDFIRDEVDLGLLTRLRRLQGEPLNYFGLPGADMLDISSWKDLLGQVDAVERAPDNIRAMDENAKMLMPELRFVPHHGEVDQVILRGRGGNWKRGGEDYRPWVQLSRAGTTRMGWYFHVVNLDYFGEFLPEGEGKARIRADAIKKLFDFQRLDAWGHWVLLLTVEAQMVNPRLQGQLYGYLNGVRQDSSAEAGTLIDFLAAPGSDRALTATRVIHAVAGTLIARSASLGRVLASPRGTILYRGSGQQPMVHLMFEFEPTAEAIAATTPVEMMLRAPILRTDLHQRPLLALAGEQVPGLTETEVTQILSYLDASQLEQIKNSMG